MLRIDLARRAWVLSRYVPTKDLPASADLAFSPVGVAAAKGGGLGGSKGGRGATGRGSGGYSSAHKTTHGWAWWHGGAYADDWYDDHDDETTRYDVRIRSVGIKRFGSSSEFRDNRPDAGPVPWDREYDSPDDFVEHAVQKPGWYRVGAHIVGKRVNHDFKWECVDFELVPSGSGYEVTNEWKVSPRI